MSLTKIKLSKEYVGYEHPAKGREQCLDCVHFEVLAHHHCEIVQGTILPGDWCRRFATIKKR